ncbi:hypothetical protein HPB49_017149 [Dermacentor silvarum]|uniref:Uncharacterized protein n=1 Tax=Dermacentor silvarum TaxID=543639 RepID=A0ACB8CYR7_DERSI|nr:hypothetical protein HPB49_017149 [Dermacentor silvarum]
MYVWCETQDVHMADTDDGSLEPTTDKPKYLRRFEGILISYLFDESRLRSACRYEPRSDYVFVGGFPKTGTTWLHFVPQRLNKHASETPAQSAAACEPNVSFLEYADGDKIQALPRPWAVIKTHLLSRMCASRSKPGISTSRSMFME